MALAAWHICLSSSSSLLMQRMILPSNTSVILHMWENAAPCMELGVRGNVTQLLYNYRIAGKLNFGGLAVYITATKLKSAKISYLHTHGNLMPNSQI